MAVAYKTSDQIAGLFLQNALERIQKGNDQIAKQNVKNLGWVSMFLSEKQENWLYSQYERDSRAYRSDKYPASVKIDGCYVGIWNCKTVEGRTKIFFTLTDAFVQGLAL